MSGGARLLDLGGLRTAVVAIENGARQAAADLAAETHALVLRHMTEDADAAGHKGRVDTGQTRQAVRAVPPRPIAGGYQSEVVVQPPADKVALVVEEGRRPGKGVSREGQARLRTWVRRKLRNQVLSRVRGARVTQANARTGRVTGVGKAAAERAIDEATFLIARKIRLRGIPGIRPFGKVREFMRAGRAAQIARAAFARATSRLR